MTENSNKTSSTEKTFLKHLLGNNFCQTREIILFVKYFTICKHLHVKKYCNLYVHVCKFCSSCGVVRVMNGERRSRCPIFSGVNMSSAAFVSHGCFKLTAKCIEQGELL